MREIGPSGRETARLKLLFQRVNPPHVGDIIKGKTLSEILALLPQFQDYLNNNPAFGILVDNKTGRAFSFRSGFSPERALEEINGIHWRRGVMTKAVATSAGGIWESLGSHIEGQAAAFMRKTGITDAVLYINATTPCLGEKGCLNSLPALLSENSRLVVYNKNAKVFPPFVGTKD